MKNKLKPLKTFAIVIGALLLIIVGLAVLAKQVEKVVEEHTLVVKKPAVYIYGKGEYELKLTPLNKVNVLTTYPIAKEDTGSYTWDITANADGNITYNEGNYPYIFWDGTYYTDYDFAEGFCIKGEDTAAFLEDTLQKIGLNEREIRDFVVYWLPEMNKSKYNLIYFDINGSLGTDSYVNDYKISLEQKSKEIGRNELRVNMIWKPIESPQTILSQSFKKFDRSADTVLVEWGGAKIGEDNERCIKKA